MLTELSFSQTTMVRQSVHWLRVLPAFPKPTLTNFLSGVEDSPRDLSAPAAEIRPPAPSVRP
jgi:hypothetical protein